MAAYGLALAMAFAAGVGLGMLFFGGLWLTVQRIPTTAWPGLLTLGSFWGRSVLCIAGFYLVMDGHWMRLVACFLGFFLARRVLIRYWRSPRPSVAVAAPRGEPV